MTADHHRRSELLRFDGLRPDLYLTVFSREYPGRHAVGMVATNSGVLGLFDRMGALVAAHLSAAQQDPSARARLDELSASDQPDLSGGRGEVDSPRHRGYVDSRTLQTHLERFAAIASGDRAPETV